jgi:hypothetical protein
VVVAVADGHGHRRHFRSGTGAALAVAVACEAGAELAARLAASEAAEQLEGAEEEFRAAVVDLVLRNVSRDWTMTPKGEAAVAVRDWGPG